MRFSFQSYEDHFRTLEWKPKQIGFPIIHYAGDQRIKARMMKRDYKRLFVRNPSVNIQL